MERITNLHTILRVVRLPAKFDKRIELFSTYLSGITMENRDESVCQHPFGGPFDIAETLHFIDVHYGNRMRHIGRILAEVK